MRLRLVIRRHSLPDTAIAWAIDAGDNPTISQLLEQLNEVIPLESSGDWGLEDYSVEIKGSGTNYECLHFQLIGAILHEDDEVLIRPLLSNDLKLRKVSGRHQITSDGRHLFDGSVFGRPRPRSIVDRPAIEIPPRKRRRITYDDEGDASSDEGALAIEGQAKVTGDQDGNRQLVLRAKFEDDDEEDDEDFAPEDEDGEDQDEEDQDEEDQDEEDQDEEDQDEEDEADEADEDIEVEEGKDGGDNGGQKVGRNADRSFLDSKKDDSSTKESRGNNLHAGTPRAQQTPAKSILRSNRSVRFAGFDSLAKPSGELALEDEGDEDVDIESRSSDSLGSSSDSSRDSSRESSSDADVLDDDDDDEAPSSEGSNSSSSDSSSDSDSRPDEVTSKPTEVASAQGIVAHETDAPSPHRTHSKEQAPVQNRKIPPGQGKRSTRFRNERRRNANLLQRFKRNAILPAGVTLQEFTQLNRDKLQNHEDALEALAEMRTKELQQGQRLSEKTSAKSTEFEEKRQKLLASLASGGVEAGLGPSMEDFVKAPSQNTDIYDRVSSTIDAHSKPSLTTAVDHAALSSEDVERLYAGISGHYVVPTPATESPTIPSGPESVDSASRPRRKIDLGAASRLVFGALGVRAPKSKSDHDKVRNDLTREIRIPKNTFIAKALEKGDCADVGEDSEAWREVISLRAVECCYEGVELSPAPFPFVQRWDPQQKGIYPKKGNRGRKGKKSQRNQSQYYDDEQQASTNRRYETYYDLNDQTFIAEAVDEEDNDQNGGTALEDINAIGSQNVASDGVEFSVNDQIMRDVQEAATSQMTDDDDLPRLPADISALPDLTAAALKTGMVIAFKQLVLSEATNWQPQLSGYRTAVVIKTSEAAELELTLAKRDREDTGKYYDEETGERIYGKFNMPTDDDENESEDDGFLSVTFAELTDPKIVQVAPESLKLSAEESQAKPSFSVDGSIKIDLENSAEGSKSSVEIPRGTGPGPKSPGNAPDDGNNSIAIRGGDLSTDDAEDLAHFILEDTRHEISVIIKDAGFRSTIPSSITRIQPQLPATPDYEETNSSYSPRFNGFDSSPSIQAILSPSLFDTTTPIADELPPPRDSHEEVPEINSNVSSVHYPKLSVPSSLASQISDRGRQPDYPLPGDSTLEDFDDSITFLGDLGDLPANGSPRFPSSQPANGSYNTSPEKKDSSPLEADTPSSGDLPSLAEVFSTARSSSIFPKQEFSYEDANRASRARVDKIADSYNKAMEELDAKELDDRVENAEAEDPEQVTPKASQRNKPAIPALSPKMKRSSPSVTQSESKSQFKIPPGSQQVDLTLSSEPEAEPDKDGDSSYPDDSDLLRNPGRAGKEQQPRRQSTVNLRTASQTESQRRISKRKTMTSFQGL